MLIIFFLLGFLIKIFGQPKAMHRFNLSKVKRCVKRESKGVSTVIDPINLNYFKLMVDIPILSHFTHLLTLEKLNSLWTCRLCLGF